MYVRIPRKGGEEKIFLKQYFQFSLLPKRAIIDDLIREDNLLFGAYLEQLRYRPVCFRPVCPPSCTDLPIERQNTTLQAKRDENNDPQDKRRTVGGIE